MSLFQNLRGGALLSMKCCTRKDNLISPVIQLLVSYKSDLMTTYALDVQVLSKSAKPNVRKCLSIVNGNYSIYLLSSMVEHFLFIFNFRPLTECLILISHTIPVIMWGTIILISQEPIIHTSLHQYIHPIFFPVRHYGLQIMTPPTKSTVFGKFGNFNIIMFKTGTCTNIEAQWHKWVT